MLTSFKMEKKRVFQLLIATAARVSQPDIRAAPSATAARMSSLASPSLTWWHFNHAEVRSKAAVVLLA